MPLMVYPKVLFPPNVSIKEATGAAGEQSGSQLQGFFDSFRACCTGGFHPLFLVTSWVIS